MISIPQYLLESGFCLAVFYAFYAWALRGETFFQLNRLYLLLTAVLSLCIPLLNIVLSKPEPTAHAPLIMEQVLYPAVSHIEEAETVLWAPLQETPGEVTILSLGELLSIPYLLGAAFLLAILGQRLWRLARLIRHSRRRAASGYTLVETDADFPAASFFGYIFWNPGKLREQEAILQHELVHIRQWHSLDVLLMELMVVFKWFNPLIYLYRRSLRATHEYIADQFVVRRSGKAHQYARLLMHQTAGQPDARLVNTFNTLIKNRLIMLAKKPSKRLQYLKYTGSIALLVALMLLFSFDLIDRIPGNKKMAAAETYLSELGEEPLVSLLSKGPDPVYQLHWGDHTCDCFEDQVENYYHCENLSFRPPELRRLLRRNNAFDVLQSTPLPIEELTIVSKRTLRLDGIESQFDKQGHFDPGAPIWSELKKGDVLKLTFRGGEKTWFKFNITINDRKETLNYAYLVELGKHKLAIDMTSGQGIKYLEAEDFRQAVQQPMSIRKNNGEPLAVEAMEVRLGYLEQEYDLKGKEKMLLRDLIPVRLAQPGDRLTFKVKEAQQELEFTYILKKQKNAIPEFPKALLRICWGGTELNSSRYGFPAFKLPRDKVLQLADQPVRLEIGGKAHQIVGLKLYTMEFRRQGITVETPVDPDKPWPAAVTAALKKARPGDFFGFNEVLTGEGVRIRFSVQVKPEFHPEAY